MVLQIKLVVVVGVTNKLLFVCSFILISKLRDKGVNEKLLTSIETKHIDGVH